VERQPHVLVIDDVPEILELMQELLEEENFRVSTPSATLPDLDEIKALDPGLIILDYFRPGQVAGWSLLQTLKLDPETCAIPVVLCTAAARDVKARGCQLAAMDIAVVLKPFDIDELLAVVKGALWSPVVLERREQADRCAPVWPGAPAVLPIFSGRTRSFTAPSTVPS
jgi:CheY-like chemotaxis protein